MAAEEAMKAQLEAQKKVMEEARRKQELEDKRIAEEHEIQK